MLSHLPLVLLALISCASAGAPKLPATIPLPNPGFEGGEAELAAAVPERFVGLITLDTHLPRSGKACLKITGRTGSENPWLAQMVDGLQGGATYAFRAWCRGERGAPALAALKIEFYNPQGQNTSSYYERQPTPATGGWQALQVRARSDADTVRAALLVRLFGPGTVWFDDLEFALVAEPPPLTLSPERQVVPAGKDCNLTVTVRLAEPWDRSQPPPLSFTLAGTNRKAPQRLKAEVTAQDGRTFQAALTVATLATGEYVLTGMRTDTAQQATARVFVPVEKRVPRNLAEKGAILVRGKPFFPIGLYHVTPEDYLGAARQGFNCVQGSATMDLAKLGQSLDTAAQIGLMVDVPLYAGGKVKDNLPVSLGKVKRFRHHPAVLNWKILDEPDMRPDVMDEVPEAYRVLKAADPDHPLLLTVASPDWYGYWANFCDILQVNPYPIPSRPLTVVCDYVGRAREILLPWQNLTAVLQAGWTREPVTQPTYDQARLMLYLALIRGAKGIFWYAYRDPGWKLDETPLWERFKDLNRETALVAQPLLWGHEAAGVQVSCEADSVVAPGEPSPPGTAVEPGKLHWMACQWEGRTLVLLANPTDQALAVTVTVPEPVNTVTCLHRGAPHSEGHTIRLQLPPEGADTVIVGEPLSLPPTQPGEGGTQEDVPGRAQPRGPGK